MDPAEQPQEPAFEPPDAPQENPAEMGPSDVGAEVGDAPAGKDGQPDAEVAEQARREELERAQRMADPGRAILIAAAEAIERIPAVVYHGKQYGTGGLAGMGTSAEGNVRMMRGQGPTSNGGWLIRATGMAITSGKPTEFDVAWKYSSTEWIDHAARKLMERPSRQARGTAYQAAVGITIRELTAGAPFGQAIAAQKFTVEERKTFDNVECDVVLVEMGKSAGKLRIAVGVQDKFPRRIERIIETSVMNGASVLDILNVRTGSASEVGIGAPLFALALPPEYEEDRIATLVRPTLPIANPKPAVGAESAPVLPGAAPVAATPKAPPVEIPETPSTAPDFSLKTPDGVTVSRDSLRGGVAVLSFFGTWALHSQEWHPRLDALRDRFKDQGVKVYAANVRERNPSAAIAHVGDGKWGFGLLMNADRTAEDFGAALYPCVAVIGAGGELVAIINGCRDDASLDRVAKAIDDALKLHGGGSGNPAQPQPQPSNPPTDTAQPAAPPPADAPSILDAPGPNPAPADGTPPVFDSPADVPMQPK